MDQLKQEEQRIDLKVLHHLNKDDNQKKHSRFRRTVFAVHTIVSSKLYKSKSTSLEAYFRDSWKISRAQVYRFLDCAIVLKQLDGFSILPGRERLCRSLKQFGRNKNNIRKLWNSVLIKVGPEHETITSATVSQAWGNLLASGDVTAVINPEEVDLDPQSELTYYERDDIQDDIKVFEHEERNSMNNLQKSSTNECHNRRAIRDSQISSKPLTYQPYHPYRSSRKLNNSISSIQSYLDHRNPSLLFEPNEPSSLQNYNSNQTPVSKSEYVESESSKFRPQIFTNIPNWRWKDSNSEKREYYQDISLDDVQSCVKLLNKFSRKGFVLQPALNNRWVESEVIQHWRLAPVFTNDNTDYSTLAPIVLTKHTKSETTSPITNMDSYPLQLRINPDYRNDLNLSIHHKSNENRIPSIFDLSDLCSNKTLHLPNVNHMNISIKSSVPRKIEEKLRLSSQRTILPEIRLRDEYPSTNFRLQETNGDSNPILSRTILPVPDFFNLQ
ncbi:hypothetical protein HK096_007572 [Nowakowskiella sp. JEL0078]|nr:hypothetical protein HK096_007572 [Nowakowskiella sp. JEL0078]